MYCLYLTVTSKRNKLIISNFKYHLIIRLSHYQMKVAVLRITDHW